MPHMVSIFFPLIVATFLSVVSSTFSTLKQLYHSKFDFDNTDTNILRVCVHLSRFVYLIRNCISCSHILEIFVFYHQ